MTWKYTEPEIQTHLQQLALAYGEQLTYLDSYGYGEWGVDQYRPFGNSMGIQNDILELAGIEPEGTEDGEEYYSDTQRSYADYLYKERLGAYLKEAIKQHCLQSVVSQNLDKTIKAVKEAGLL